MTHPTRKRFLGQHFLQNPSVLRIIVGAAELRPDDTVLEIGPGTGALTGELLPRAKLVIAVEKDIELAEALRNAFPRAPNLRIVAGDIVHTDLDVLGLRSSRYKIVANIPYYLTGRIFRLMFESWPRPSRAVLMVQKEVAERVTARAPKMNRLAAIVQSFSRPRIVRTVSRNAFTPAPKVDSAILELADMKRPHRRDAAVTSLISLGFSHPRKLLTSNLASKFDRRAVIRACAKLSVPATARPAALTPAQWEHLSTFLA